jgi:hypothetical protein
MRSGRGIPRKDEPCRRGTISPVGGYPGCDDGCHGEAHGVPGVPAETELIGESLVYRMA